MPRIEQTAANSSWNRLRAGSLGWYSWRLCISFQQSLRTLARQGFVLPNSFGLRLPGSMVSGIVVRVARKYSKSLVAEPVVLVGRRQS